MDNSLILRQVAIDALCKRCDLVNDDKCGEKCIDIKILEKLPSVEPEIIRCKDCKYWERQTYQGTPLSWGHCESELMWDSINGETYEVAHIETYEEHFCGYAERITE